MIDPSRKRGDWVFWLLLSPLMIIAYVIAYIHDVFGDFLAELVAFTVLCVVALILGYIWLWFALRLFTSMSHT